MIETAVVIWAVIAFLTLLFYIAWLADTYGDLYKLEKLVVVGCIFWPWPLFIYLLGGIVELLTWSLISLWNHIKNSLDNLNK